MTNQQYQSWIFVARILAILLIGLETILNATAAAASGGVVVITTIILTLAGAAAIPIGMRAWQSGMKIPAMALCGLFLPLVLIISFTSSLERVALKIDAAHQTKTSVQRSEDIAQAAYDTVKATKERECGSTPDEYDRRKERGACKAAEKAFVAQSAKLSTALDRGEGVVGDVLTERIAKLLEGLGVGADGVRTYFPMIWPLTLLLGGYIFAGLGFGHGTAETPPQAPVAPMVTVEPEAITRGRVTKDEAMAAIVSLIAKSGAHRLEVQSIRGLAASIGAAPASLDKWMKEWNGTRLIVRRASGKISISAKPQMVVVGE